MRKYRFKSRFDTARRQSSKNCVISAKIIDFRRTEAVKIEVSLRQYRRTEERNVKNVERNFIIKPSTIALQKILSTVPESSRRAGLRFDIKYGPTLLKTLAFDDFHFSVYYYSFLAEKISFIRKKTPIYISPL